MASPPTQTTGGFSAVLEAHNLTLQQIEYMQGLAGSTMTSANAAITALGDFKFVDLPSPPTEPTINPNNYVIAAAAAEKPTIPDGLIDQIAKLSLREPELEDGESLVSSYLSKIDDDLEDVGTFTPSVTLDLPVRPDALTTQQLDRPEVEETVIPARPSFQLPVLAALEELNVPSFVFPTLPSFDDPGAPAAPEVPDLGALARWNEPAYQRTILDESFVTIRSMLAGGSGLPLAVEEAIFERARDKAQRLAVASYVEVAEALALRGIRPGGLLTAAVAKVALEANASSNNASRDLYIRVAELGVENARTAVAGALSAEQFMFSVTDAGLRRSFEMLTTYVKAETSRFNDAVTLFNGLQQSRTIAADVWKTQIQALIDKAKEERQMIEAELNAKGTVNKNRIDAFTGQVTALREIIEAYTADMRGAEVHSNIQKTKMDRYRTDVEALREYNAARKLEFDAYETAMGGEKAKADIIQSEASAFVAETGAIASKASVRAQQIGGLVSGINAAIAKFSALLGLEEAKVRHRTAVTTASVGAYSADVGRYGQDLQADTSRNSAQVAALGSLDGTLAKLFEVHSSRYVSVLGSLIEQAKVLIEAIKAAGDMASSMASSAMAGMHAQVSMRGGGDANYSESHQTQISYNTEF